MAPFLPNIEDDMLARYLAGETDDAENAMISDWLAADEAHRRRMEAFRKIWEAGAGLGSADTFDVDAAWQKVKVKTVARPAARIIPLWRKAAVWAGLLAAAGAATWWWMAGNPAPAPLSFRAAHTGDSLVLADASVIKARKGANITYHQNFDQGDRQITLKGEAYFRVTRDTRKPFRVHAGYTDVEVLGTEFNVRESDTLTTVFVQHGRVKVSAGGTHVIITAGQGATVRPGGQPVVTEKADANEIGYLTRKLHFRNATLQEVQNMLLRQYGIKLILRVDQPALCRINTRFAGETPEQIMEVLTATLNLTWSREGDAYVLKGAGCK